MSDKVIRSDEEWRKCLTPEQYRVLRRHGTERAFTGEYHASKEEGLYTCAGCGAPLFASATKFDSGTGWPSFWEPVEGAAVETRTDRSFFMKRTEVLCARCEGQLGRASPRLRLGSGQGMSPRAAGRPIGRLAAPA